MFDSDVRLICLSETLASGEGDREDAARGQLAISAMLTHPRKYARHSQVLSDCGAV